VVVVGLVVVEVVVVGLVVVEVVDGADLASEVSAPAASGIS
jgi:hypothetical protein